MAKHSICAIPGCCYRVRMRGLCSNHYVEWLARGKECSVDGCHKLVCNGRGWCSPHYRRWLRHGDPLAGNAPHRAARQWIFDNRDHHGTECLIWPFGRTGNGYAVVRMDFKQKSMQTASRAMCEVAHGMPPHPWYEAAHSCGNGSGGCVNPLHLRWATPLDNRGDKLRHGTQSRGSSSATAKLTEAQVLEIRSMPDLPYSHIAKQFGVSAGTIRRIRKGIDWSWLK